MDDSTSTSSRFLLCRMASIVCALPLPHVIETMRPLPIHPLGGMEPLVRGLSVIRGTPVPVVDAGALLDAPTDARPGRFVTLRIGDRVAALAVQEIVGVRELDPASLGALPPLVERVPAGVMESIGTLDADLLVVLRGGRIVPEAVWDALPRGAVGP